MNILTEIEKPEGVGDTKTTETVEPKSVLYRYIVGMISVIWFSFLPMYFTMIYMFNRHFYSFEFLSDNIFGMKALVISGVVLLSILSLYLFGWIPVLFGTLSSKKKTGKYKGGYVFWLIVTFSLAIFMHYCMYKISLYSSCNLNFFYGSSVFALILCFYLATFFVGSVIDRLNNWIPTAVFIFFTAFFPIMNMKITADLVEIPLRAFRVGGELPVKVTQWKDQKLVFEGKLLLRTPTNLYVSTPKEGKTITTVLHYNNDFRIDVEDVQKTICPET